MTMMMSVQLKIWKRLITNQLPLAPYHPLSFAISLRPPPLPFNSKSRVTFANFCTETTPTTTPPREGAVTQVLLNKCGLSEEEIAKAFKHNNSFLRAKSSENLEEILKLLNGCGLTTPAQIRRVVLSNPKVLLCKAERNIQSKLSLLRTFMKEEDISKLLISSARLFGNTEDKLKSAILLLQRLGVEGSALSELMPRQPRLLTTSEEKVMESFKQVENLGIKKGSKMFANALRSILGVGKEKIERRLQCLSSLGFSEKQVFILVRQKPWILGLSEEKLRRNVDFAVDSMGLSLADIVKNTNIFSCNLEKTIIPRYRVIKALESSQVEELKGKIHSPRILYLTEKRFLDKYVYKNAESSNLLDIYHGAKAGKLIIDEETACLNQRNSQKF